MKKGLKTTLLAVAGVFAGISSSQAYAPTIRSLPDIRIGDVEDNIATDNNYFVFTNAFKFDDYAQDSDTTVSSLLWTFDEGSEPGAISSAPAVNYYRVNSKLAVHARDLDAAGDTSVTLAHVNPATANELRQAANSGSPYASFRDIVLTPGTGPLLAGFPTPSGITKTNHQTGKVVTFWASDGTNAASDSILVKTIDNTTDFASAVGVVWVVQNKPITNQSAWQQSSVSNATLSYDATQKALIETCGTSAGNKFGGWQEKNYGDDVVGNQNQHMTIASVAGKFVRAKFGVYATGGTTPYSTAVDVQNNQIPNFRARVQDRFGYTSLVEVLHSTNSGDPDGGKWGQDLRPSTDPNNPSFYRIDVAPPALPSYTGNTTEGLQRELDLYGVETTQYGTIGMAESSIGYYDALNVSSTDPTILKKSYSLTADFQGMDFLARKVDRNNMSVDFGEAKYHGESNITENPVTGFQAIPSSEIGYVINPGGTPGLTVYTSGLADTFFGVVAVDWLNGNAADRADSTVRLRVQEGKQYVISFTATATGASSDQPMIRFRSRVARFQWTHRLEVGGAWNLLTSNTGLTRANQTTRMTHVVAREYLPGTGGYAGTSSTGGVYHMLVTSPLNKEIRPDVNSTDIRVRMPLLGNEPGPGQALTVHDDGTPRTNSSQQSRRDIYPGIDILDSLDGTDGNTGSFAGTSDPAEKGNIAISKIEIREFPLVND